MIVQPPRTVSGRGARTFPTAGKKPASIMIPAPVAIVKRLITFVMATRPMFWLNEVIGIQPNRPETELTNPSQARLPDIYLSVGSRSNTLDARAEVSPIVSVADTMKMLTENYSAKAEFVSVLLICTLESPFSRSTVTAGQFGFRLTTLVIVESLKKPCTNTDL